MTKTKLTGVSGIFHDKGIREGVVVYPEEGAPVNLSSLFEDLVGRRVELVLHYYPPSGVFDPTKPGAGCCMLAQHCGAGHVLDPGHLFSMALNGVLGKGPTGTWVVGSTLIPLSEQMDGHYGRLILYSEGEIPDNSGVENLLQEALNLSELLSSLRGAIKGST